jgi:myo-inositol-1(or 4)-monophosphatase
LAANFWKFSNATQHNGNYGGLAIPNLSDYSRVCEEAVRAGGRTILDWAGRFNVRKKGPADLVTQADIASQEAVSDVVLGAFPEHSLLGEEGVQKVAEPRAAYRWIVDPLDGTTNYVHGVPHYCISLALERNGELLVGAVYDPLLDECFAAAAGQGALLNGRPLKTSAVADLSDALAAVGFPPGVKADHPDVQMFLEMLVRCQAIRRSGSSALNLCYLAAGRFDLYWSYATKIWDVAAGVLLVREAGGIVTSPTGGPFCLEEAHFLAAANPALHAQLAGVAARTHVA